MAKDRTTQNGYFHFKTEEVDKWCHFSTNYLWNLQKNTGKKISDYFAEYQKMDQFEQAFAVAEIVYASMLAYDQEEGNDIDYNEFNVRNWISDLSEEKTAEFLEAMAWNAEGVGKKKTKQK